MATQIENNVVSMSFDNSNFEKHANTTLSTLDKLRKSLNFSGTADSLNDVSAAFSNVDTSTLQNGVQEVHNRFSALEIMAITALTNITNKAVDAGTRIAKALTLDSIASGFSEYELMMNSVQTIMSGTGESLDVVMSKLDELNQYADDTIYVFSDMTQNIGKFTNAGVDLETAVQAMKGLSNEAALSGANAVEASRAMYNIAQSLSMGYMQYIDWKSIENANMATKDFKENLVETALDLGTLTEAAVKAQPSINALFKDKLKDGWLTNDVLLQTLSKYSDETTELGKKAYAAAQDVKTFHQMWDTALEAAGSGWAKTFQYIVGDFDQAKTLWTSVSNYLNDVIGKQADARNALFKTWNEAGGRQYVIDGLTQAFHALRKVTLNIGLAFKDVFEGLDNSKLFDLSTSFFYFAKNLNESLAPAAKDIRHTFQGLFSVLDIGIQVVTAIGRAFYYLVSNSGLGGLAKSILGVTGTFGEFIYGIDQSLKKNDTFYKALKRVADFLLTIPRGANAAFKALTGMDFLTAIDKFSDKLGYLLDHLSELGNKFQEFAGGILGSALKNITDKFNAIGDSFDKTGEKAGLLETIFTGLFKVLSSIGTGILTVMDKIGEGLTKAFSQTDMTTIMDFINTAGLAGSFSAFLIQLKNLLDPLDDIGDMITNIREDLAILQTAVKADVILKIAEAVGILAVSCLVLASIDADRLAAPFAVITGFMTELSVAFGIMDHFANSSDTFGEAIKGLIDATAQKMQADVMVKMAGSILILAGALKVISSIEPERLTGSMTALSILLGEMTGVSLALSNFGGSSKVGGFISMATSIVILAGALKIISTIDTDKLSTSVFALTIVLTELTTAMTALSFMDGKQIKKACSGLIGFSAGIVILSVALKMMGDLDNIGQSLLTFGFTLAAITTAFKLMPNGSTVMAQSVGITILAAGMLLLTQSLKTMGEMDSEQMQVALTGLVVSLAAVVASMEAINLMMDEKQMIAASAALATATGVIVVLGATLKMLGGMSMGEMGVALLGFSGSLMVLAVALNTMKGTIGGAGALIIAAGAMMLLVPSLKLLSTIPFGTMMLTLVELAAAIGLLAGASILLGPVLPIMAAFAGTLALFGAAAALVGVGVLALATGLATLAVSGVAGATAMVGVLSVLLGAIPMVVNAIGLFFKSLLMVYIELIPLIVEAVAATITATLNKIKELTPLIGQTILVVGKTVLLVLRELVPDIIETGYVLLASLMTSLRDHISEIAQLGIDIVTELLNGIAIGLPNLIDSAFNVIISFIDGLGQAIEDNAEDIRNAMIGFCVHLWNAFCEFFGIHSPSTKMNEGGVDLIDGLIEGIDSMIESVKTKIGELKDAVLAKLSEKIESFKEKGQAFMNKVRDGAESVRESLKSKMTSIAESMKDKLNEKKEEFKTVGSNFMEGLKNGIESMRDTVYNKASEIGGTLLSKLKSALKEASPSKATFEMGQFVDEGLINGMDDLKKKVTKAAVGVANSVLSSLSNTIDEEQDSIYDIFDISPSIKPMLDLSGIQNGVRSISDLINGESYDNAMAINSNLSSKRNNENSVNVSIRDGNNGIINAINNLRDDLNEASEKIASMQMVLDGKTLVGELAPVIDTALGKQTIRAGRGN